MAASTTDQKLKFEVAFVSEEDEGHPASELNVHGPKSRGWASPKFASFPLELGIRFARGPVRLRQVQILSHQYKIASRIELYAGRSPTSYYDADWRRLGYLTLDPNERTAFKARELKSVFVDERAHFLKLVVAKPHVNDKNITRQVGLIAINVVGEQLEPGSIPNVFAGSGGRSTGGRRGGSSYDVGRRAKPGGDAGPADLAVDMGFDPETARMYRELHALKLEAVEKEDFLLAKAYKEAEGMVRQAAGKLASLIDAKQRAVSDEDYDRAAAIKAEIDALRSEIRARATGAAYGHQQQQSHVAPAAMPGYHPHTTPYGPTGFNGGGGGSMMPPPSTTGGVAYGTDPYGRPPHAGGWTDSHAAAGHASVGQPLRPAAIGQPATHHAAVGQPLRPVDGAGSAALPSSLDPATRGWDEAAMSHAARSDDARGSVPPSGGYMDPPTAGGQPAVAGSPPRASHTHEHQQQQPSSSSSSMAAASPPRAAAAFGRGGRPAAPSPAENRQIRPAAAGGDIFKTVQPGEKAEDDPDAAAAAAPGQPRADPDQLQGAEGVEELPEPEPLTTKAADRAGSVVGTFGEYAARALVSNERRLRLAAWQHLSWAVGEAAAAGGRGTADLPPCGAALRSMAEAMQTCGGPEKNAHVFADACRLTAEAASAAAGVIGAEATERAMEPALRCFVAHLADNGARQRQAAIDALLAVAGDVGATPVSRLCTAPLAGKEKGKPRPLTSRLTVLSALLQDRGLLDEGAVTPGELLEWSVANKCHENKNGDVREAAKALAVALLLTAGPSVRGRLGHLRGKQREEYEEAFDVAEGKAPVARGRGRGRGGGGARRRRGAGRGGRGGRGRPPAGRGGGGSSRRQYHDDDDDDDDIFADDLGNDGGDDEADYFRGMDGAGGPPPPPAAAAAAAAAPGGGGGRFGEGRGSAAVDDSADDFFDDGLGDFDEFS